MLKSATNGRGSKIRTYDIPDLKNRDSLTEKQKKRTSNVEIRYKWTG
jgi:hypothetical protein